MLIVTLVAIVLAIWQLDLFVEDWRHGNSNCELHNLEMDTIVVHGINGPAPSMMPEFFDAKETTQIPITPEFRCYHTTQIPYAPDLPYYQ